MMADWPTLLACQSGCCTSPNLDAAGALDRQLLGRVIGHIMTRPTDGRVQYRHALLRFVRARQRHCQDRDLFADDRADRGTGGRPTMPSPSASTASFPSAAHAPPATPAQHAHCAASPPPAASQSLHSPSIPDAANPVTGHAGHRARPARQSTRWPGPLFLPLPQRPVAGPPRPATTATPSRQTSDPGRCGPL